MPESPAPDPNAAGAPRELSEPLRRALDGRVRRRRERHGRGLRGPVLPHSAPAHRTRREHFDQLVLEALDNVNPRYSKKMRHLEIAVEDVPPSDPAPWEHSAISLGRCFPGDRLQPPRVAIYRRPIETRAEDQQHLEVIVRDVVVEQLAHLLHIEPEDLDAHYGT